jgi:hypothetical protein
MQYWVHEYVMDIYVCEKCKFTLFIDSASYQILAMTDSEVTEIEYY